MPCNHSGFASFSLLTAFRDLTLNLKKRQYTGVSLYGLISYGPTWLYGLAVCCSPYNQAPLLERVKPPKLLGSSYRKVVTITKISLI